MRIAAKGYQARQDDKKAPITEEYKKAFADKQQRYEEIKKEITPEHAILAEKNFNGQRFVVKRGNIVDSKAEILVSSDDNYLQARGGVAKAILDIAGDEVRSELHRHKRFKLKQGDIVSTTGGAAAWRAILHPAVIDIDQNRYPEPKLIAKVIESAMTIADAIGGKSAAFPVLGAGTASKLLTAWDSIVAIVEQIKKMMHTKATSLEYIELYIFDTKEINLNDLKALFE
jgi:O-acetyl-ADP-ribose deacetylase (regulator of RNase III)